MCFVSFFNLIEKLYTFVANSSKRHSAFIKMQEKLYPEQRPLELQKLSETKWAHREAAPKTMWKILPAVLHREAWKQIDNYASMNMNVDCRRICINHTEYGRINF